MQFQLIQKNNKKRKKAYSLLEIIVSLSIMGIAMTVMINFMILSLQISTLSLSRSFVREELSNIASLISRDIRNANRIDVCLQNSCTMVDDGGNSIQWVLDKDTSSISKVVKGPNSGTGEILTYNQFTSSSSIKVDSLDFSPGYTIGAANDNRNVIITISASHANPTLKINNIIKQTSVSTRNLDIVK